MIENARESWMAAAQDELFCGWKRWASFACIWVWSCLSLVLATKDSVLQQLPNVLALPNEVVLIATAVALLGILFISPFIESIIRSRMLMGISGILLLCGSVSYAGALLTGI